MTQVSGLSTLAFTHSGSGVNSNVQLPSSAVLEWSTDTGISRLGAASLAIGNGTAGDITGALTLKVVNISDTGANADLVMLNTTAATALTTNASPRIQLQYNSWHSSSVSVPNYWTVGVAANNAGSDQPSIFTIVHVDPTGGASTWLSLGTQFQIQSQGLTTLPDYSFVGSGGYGFMLRAGVALDLCINAKSIVDMQAASFLMWSGLVLGWGSTSQAHTSGADTGISRLNPASLAIGNGTAGDFSGTLKCATVNATSSYQANGTPGVTQTAIAVGTLATIEGIVTTFTGVSDERLKNHAPYTGGLEEILGITPIRFTYNELGQKFGGWDKEHVYVGFSAQNVQKSIPEAIQGTEGKEKYLSFDDRPVIAALCNAIKELTARITELEMSVRYLLEHCRRSVPGNRAQ
jgi:hypothetical protein